MVRLICDGPGWTDDVAFYSYKGSLIGYDSNPDIFIKFNEPLENSLNILEDNKDLDIWNEDDGLHYYLEGDKVEEFNPNEFFDQPNYNFVLNDDSCDEYNSLEDFFNEIKPKDFEDEESFEDDEDF